MLTHQLSQYSSDLKHKGLYRHRQVTHESLAGEVSFSSNDYLSLTSDTRVKQAYQKGYERYSTGSGGSMVVCGYHSTHQALEQAFAKALQVDDCILFSSGYAANLSVMSLLARLNAHVLLDKGVHASIYDGLYQVGADYSRYLHHDLTDLVLKAQSSPKNTVIVTESIFSMSGQCAPLAAISQLSQSHAFELLVDEAHAFGVVGEEGLGAVHANQLSQNEVPLRIIPLGKAFAGSGAIVAGRKDWIDGLLQSARPLIYSTAISPACAYGLRKTLDIIREANERRTKLNELVSYFREAIKQSPLQWRDSISPIQQLQLGCPHRALSFSMSLQTHGIHCLPMRQPTVSKQETGLRVILNYHHQPEQIDRLFTCLHKLQRVE